MPLKTAFKRVRALAMAGSRASPDATAGAGGEAPPSRPRDPRWYQIACLTALLVYGLIALSFEISVAQAAVTIGTALATQFACTKWKKLPAFDPKSAMISALSLCLLLRTNSIGWAALAAFVAIASKFVIRIRGKHVFNPTNGALMSLI